MCLSMPKAPTVVTPPAPAQDQDPSIMAALDAERKRRASSKGYTATLLTGGAGLTGPAATSTKTLLGQ